MVGKHGHTGAHVVCAWGPVIDVNGRALRKDKRKNLLEPVVTLGLGHSASKPKGSFVRYTGCLPRVSTP